MQFSALVISFFAVAATASPLLEKRVAWFRLPDKDCRNQAGWDTCAKAFQPCYNYIDSVNDKFEW